MSLPPREELPPQETSLLDSGHSTSYTQTVSFGFLGSSKLNMKTEKKNLISIIDPKTTLKQCSVQD